MTDKPKVKKQTIITLSNGREFVLDYTEEQHQALLNKIRAVRVPSLFLELDGVMIRILDISTIERR